MALFLIEQIGDMPYAHDAFGYDKDTPPKHPHAVCVHKVLLKTIFKISDPEYLC